MEEEKLLIELTGMEVVYLVDSISNGDIAQGLPDREAYKPVAREALLLLGSAYKELVAPAGILPGPVPLMITEEQAWLFRSKVKTGDVDLSGANLGVALLLKLYDLLCRFNSGINLDVGDVESTPIDEAGVEFLSFLKEHPNATSSPS